MTVSSPPSRPDPDGGETGSGNGRSPPPLPPSNPENSNASSTMNSQIQSAGENAGLSGNNNTPQSEVEQGNLETGANGDLGNSPSMPGNESADVESTSSPENTDALIRSFPIAKLQKLDELISNPRWVIPVLPKDYD